MIFKKKKHIGEEQTHDTRVEVVVHQNARKEAVKEAKDVNQKVNRLLTENGFTFKIYLAAGGKNGKAKA